MSRKKKEKEIDNPENELEPQEDTPTEDDELEELSELYKIDSGEHLQNIQEDLLKSIQEIIENKLQMLKDIESGKYAKEEAIPKIEEIDHFMTVFGNELDNEMTRIENTPGGYEAVEGFREQTATRLGPTVAELQKMLDEL